jgi:hypothetical protein
MKVDAFSFVVFVVSFLAIILVLTEPQHKDYSIKELKDSLSQDSAEENKDKSQIYHLDEDQTEIAYKIGYKRGYDNFMNTSVDSKDESAVEYTSNEDKDKDKDKIDLDSEIVQEIIMKGYIDGYHKAGESLHCPRNNY